MSRYLNRFLTKIISKWPIDIVEICLTSLLFREMRIENTIRYHHIPKFKRLRLPDFTRMQSDSSSYTPPDVQGKEDARDEQDLGMREKQVSRGPYL